MEGLENKNEENSLWKHSEIYHQGELGRDDFKMVVIERHRTPLTRQVQEGVELEVNKADLILNSKSEWNHSRIPRIVIEMGEEIEENTESGMNKGRKKWGRIKCPLTDAQKRVRGGGDKESSEEEGWKENKRKKLEELQQVQVKEGARRKKVNCRSKDMV